MVVGAVLTRWRRVSVNNVEALRTAPSSAASKALVICIEISLMVVDTAVLRWLEALASLQVHLAVAFKSVAARRTVALVLSRQFHEGRPLLQAGWSLVAVVVRIRRVTGMVGDMSWVLLDLGRAELSVLNRLVNVRVLLDVGQRVSDRIVLS